MIRFNIEINYLTQIVNYLDETPKGMSKIFVIADLTDTPGKFINHLKFYIDNQKHFENFRDITFNDDYTKIRVEEVPKSYYYNETDDQVVFAYHGQRPANKSFVELTQSQAQSIAKVRNKKIIEASLICDVEN